MTLISNMLQHSLLTYLGVFRMPECSKVRLLYQYIMVTYCSPDKYRDILVNDGAI
jgi:hypothetical protein